MNFNVVKGNLLASQPIIEFLTCVALCLSYKLYKEDSQESPQSFENFPRVLYELYNKIRDGFGSIDFNQLKQEVLEVLNRYGYNSIDDIKPFLNFISPKMANEIISVMENVINKRLKINTNDNRSEIVDVGNNSLARIVQYFILFRNLGTS